MKFKYPLPEVLLAQASTLDEFANGAAQCHARLIDGTSYSGILISNATAVVAMRGQKSLPFSVDLVQELYQSDDDRSPVSRGGWDFFDKWQS